MSKSEIKVLLILRHPRIRDIFKSYVCNTKKKQTCVYWKEEGNGLSRSWLCQYSRLGITLF